MAIMDHVFECTPDVGPSLRALKIAKVSDKVRLGGGVETHSTVSFVFVVYDNSCVILNFRVCDLSKI